MSVALPPDVRGWTRRSLTAKWDYLFLQKPVQDHPRRQYLSCTVGKLQALLSMHGASKLQFNLPGFAFAACVRLLKSSQSAVPQSSIVYTGVTMGVHSPICEMDTDAIANMQLINGALRSYLPGRFWCALVCFVPCCRRQMMRPAEELNPYRQRDATARNSTPETGSVIVQQQRSLRDDSAIDLLRMHPWLFTERPKRACDTRFLVNCGQGI